MRETLEHLQQLQAIDTELKRLEELRGDLPLQVSQLETELNTIQSKLDEQEKTLEASRLERTQAESEIKDLETRRKKYQDQLYEVKNNREYDAVSQEIEAVKLKLEENETRVLEHMNQEDALVKEIEEIKKEIESLKKQCDEKKSKLNEKLAATEKEELMFKDKRDKIVPHIQPRLISAYERIRKAKNGSAVVPIVRGTCGGCYKALPPQRILEVRQMNKLYLCDVCGRMLIWDESVAEHNDPE